jgi:hypothetical protein
MEKKEDKSKGTNQRGQDSLIVSIVCGKLLKCQDDHVLMKLVGFTML